jgi:hypothetical protein
MVGQLVIVLRQGSFQDGIVGPLGSTIGELLREAENLNLRSVVQHLSRIKQTIDARVELTPESLVAMMTEVQNRMVDELSSRLFLAVPEIQESFYKDRSLFGNDVEKKFTEMSEDISEAGKCLALNRNTASVFHLMRIMELAVQRFGTQLGVTLASEQNWQVILDQINAAIRKRDAKRPDTKRYAEAASHLYNVKVAWRNEVMHPKQTYTDEEARAIFGNVRTFVGDLAELI